MIERIADLDNLYLAYHKAKAGKEDKREVKAYASRLEQHLETLRENILTGSPVVGHYHYFTIHDPKERIICAASFGERVLHHALMNVCHDYFDHSLIDDTYATRKGKGQYAALEKARHAANRYHYLVKLDVRKYFDSIGHDVLKRQLEHKFKDERLLSIFFRIIDSYHTSPGCGLPIGNLTSQYFANQYLSGMDHLAKEKWKAPIYIRYMDDILLAGNDKGQLKECVERMNHFSLETLHLHFKPPVFSTNREGVSFLGYRILQHRLNLSGRSKKRYRNKLLLYHAYLDAGLWSEQQYADHVRPLAAFALHADCFAFRKSCLNATGAYREWV